jgi:hypothetical protein
MIASAAAFPVRPHLQPHAGSAPARRYEPRRPEKTQLHRIVSENLESIETTLPYYVGRNAERTAAILWHEHEKTTDQGPRQQADQPSPDGRF